MCLAMKSFSLICWRGLGGVHYAMLIVAADEGIAAQTKEHLAILRQLQFSEIW